MLKIQAALHKVSSRKDLSETEASAVMNEILRGESTPALTAALLTALRMKGETVNEVTGFARAMRANAVPVRPNNTAPEDLVDTCGTGGDGGGTFNISTVAAFVVAGAGVAVAKHGNRSVSSKCGSADVLEACGVNIDLTAEQAAKCIDEVGIGFLFAPNIHPAMRHAGPVRKELGMRTVFNLLGPLTNPAGAGAQVMGVFDESVVELAADVLCRLGVKRAFVVHGSDGLDEITTTGPTKLAEVRDGAVSVREVTPEGFGVPRANAADLGGGDRDANSATLRAILGGEKGPKRDIVLVNAAAALVAAGKVRDFREGVEIAQVTLDRGISESILVGLVQASRADQESR